MQQSRFFDKNNLFFYDLIFAAPSNRTGIFSLSRLFWQRRQNVLSILSQELVQLVAMKYYSTQFYFIIGRARHNSSAHFGVLFTVATSGQHWMRVLLFSDCCAVLLDVKAIWFFFLFCSVRFVVLWLWWWWWPGGVPLFRNQRKK